MATGTAVLFAEAQMDAWTGAHVLGTDTLKIAIVNNTAPPTVNDTSPQWSDYSANEVSTSGNYPAGGVTLTSVSFDMTSNVATLTAADILIAISATGFTDGYWAILVNASASNLECIGFWDLGGPVSEQAGPVSLEFPAGVVAEFPPNVAS